MKKLNLDKLLDNDHLTPDQERQVRRMIDYEIKSKFLIQDSRFIKSQALFQALNLVKDY